MSKTIQNQPDPSIFIPKPARIFAILQLCIALTMVLFYAAQPFMGQLFESKSRLLQWDYVLDVPEGEALLAKDRQAFEEARQLDEAKLASSFRERLSRSLKILAFGIPPFEQAWLLLSLILPILLLKRVEGARRAVWLIPLCVLVFSINNRLNGSAEASNTNHLYPSEAQISQDYLKQPIVGSLEEQRELLLKGWQLYVIDHWLGQTPSTDIPTYNRQVKQGEWRFQVEKARYQMQHAKSGLEPYKLPLWILGTYLLWNVMFASVCAFRGR